MPEYCIDVDPREYGDHTLHSLKPGACSHLPRIEHQENVGWHPDVLSALAHARLRYKAVAACIYCCHLGDMSDDGETQA